MKKSKACNLVSTTRSIWRKIHISKLSRIHKLMVEFIHFFLFDVATYYQQNSFVNLNHSKNLFYEFHLNKNLMKKHFFKVSNLYSHFVLLLTLGKGIYIYNNS